MKKIAVIINPKAGSNNKKLLKEVIEKLSVSHQLTIFETNKPGDATEIAKKESSNFDLVAVAGGDGTIHEVINGINHLTPLAIIPTGTANIVAIECGISKNAASICNAIQQGITRKAYLHNINKKKFILMVGVGYDAQVVANIKPESKKIFGKFIFAWEGFKQFFYLKKFNIKAEINGKIYVANWMLITNATHYAGRFKITNQTSIFDSHLICYLFPNLTKLDFLYYLFLIIFYRDLTKARKIIKLQVNCIKILSQKTPLQTDGELKKNCDTKITKTNQYIKIIISKKHD